MCEIFEVGFPYVKFLFLAWSVCVLFFFIARLLLRTKVDTTNLLTFLGLVTLGFVTGVIMSNNRKAISDTVMTSVFTLIGGVIAYAFIKSDTREKIRKGTSEIEINTENKFIISMLLIQFPLALLYGVQVGGVYRQKNEMDDEAVKFEIKQKYDSLEVKTKTLINRLEMVKYQNSQFYKNTYEAWKAQEVEEYKKQLQFARDVDEIPPTPDYFTK
jgi:cytochrome c biogenesis factor